MKLYEINGELEKLIDPETGEIADFELFEHFGMERTAKIENIALWIKNLDSDAESIRAEEKNLKARRVSAENNAERLREFLTSMLSDGEKFETSRVKLSWRKSESVKILIPEDDFIAWAKTIRPDVLRFEEPTINRTAIKKMLNAGEEITAATILQSNNLQIK